MGWLPSAARHPPHWGQGPGKRVCPGSSLNTVKLLVLSGGTSLAGSSLATLGSESNTRASGRRRMVSGNHGGPIEPTHRPQLR